jgi:hypothetical protein
MLSPKQRLAVFLHIGGYSNTEMSAQIGVHPSTVRRWMHEPEFARTLKEETEHAMARARAQAQAAARRVADNACAAARATQTLLLSDKTDPKIIIQCAKVMLQSLATLTKIIHEPAVVPLLESEDPTQNAADPCETVSDEEMAQTHLVRRKLEEDEKEAEDEEATTPIATATGTRTAPVTGTEPITKLSPPPPPNSAQKIQGAY